MATPELAGIPVLILKEGASRSKGSEVQHANIMAARIVAETVKSALDPKGMDKMLVDGFGDVTITSDGRTILDEMEIKPPVAKMAVKVAINGFGRIGRLRESADFCASKEPRHNHSVGRKRCLGSR